MQTLTAIFDIGRTNKKLLLFDEQYQVVEEFSETLPEIGDEDGFPCDDVALLTDWIQGQWRRVSIQYPIKAVNVAAYGASLVHVDANGKPVAPLYSYLKPYPPDLADQFYGTYGEVLTLARQTSSPPMGMLNSGLQLYWLKHRQAAVFERVRWSLHLPQYVSFVLTGQPISDFTSIGCHTALWDFGQRRYHDWVLQERIHHKLAPIVSEPVIREEPSPAHPALTMHMGGGLHDSSSVIMAYLSRCAGEFMVLSTGTWCIALNPFHPDPLTEEQLRRDCLSYLTVGGAFIKASRLFMGREHDYQLERLATHFQCAPEAFRAVAYEQERMERLQNQSYESFAPACMTGTGPFPDLPAHDWDFRGFQTKEDAYTALLLGLVDLVKVSVGLVDNGVPTLYVDGGFARNGLFMQLLANVFPKKAVYTSQLPQATAIGAALFIRQDDEPVSGWTFERVAPVNT